MANVHEAWTSTVYFFLFTLFVAKCFYGLKTRILTVSRLLIQRRSHNSSDGRPWLKVFSVHLHFWSGEMNLVHFVPSISDITAGKVVKQQNACAKNNLCSRAAARWMDAGWKKELLLTWKHKNVSVFKKKQTERLGLHVALFSTPYPTMLHYKDTLFPVLW